MSDASQELTVATSKAVGGGVGENDCSSAHKGSKLSILRGVASWDLQENSKLNSIAPLQGHQICSFWNSLLHLLLINLEQ